MFDTFLGLPLHPLVVHLTVILGPVVAVMAMIAAALPGRRPGLLWPTAVGAVVATVVTWVTKEAGEQLMRRLSQAGADVSTLEPHEEAGERLFLVTAVFTVIVLIAAYVWRREGLDQHNARTVADIVVSILVVAAAVALVLAAFSAGHSGAEAVWSEVGSS